MMSVLKALKTAPKTLIQALSTQLKLITWESHLHATPSKFIRDKVGSVPYLPIGVVSPSLRLSPTS